MIYKNFFKSLLLSSLALTFALLPAQGQAQYEKVKAATINTGGYSTATGSYESPVTVTTLAQLQNAFNSKKHHIIIAGEIYGGSSLTTLTFADTSWNNLTIEGKPGTNPILTNIQLKFDGEMLSNNQNISNIVVKNISFRGRISDLQRLSGSNIIPGGSGTNYEGISFRRCTNAFVTNCTIYDTSDDLMSITLASDNVTVSYCHFYFTNDWLNMNPNPLWNWVGKYQDLASERLAMVIGANSKDSYYYGGKKLHVTMHHNWFGPNIKGRPLIRGYVHLYNNYFDNSTTPSGTNSRGTSKEQYNAMQIGSGSMVYSESNYFYKTKQSNQLGLDNGSDFYSFYEKSTNFYNLTTGNKLTGKSYPNSSIFNYSYYPESVMNVPNDVQQNAGAR